MCFSCFMSFLFFLPDSVILARAEVLKNSQFLRCLRTTAYYDSINNNCNNGIKILAYMSYLKSRTTCYLRLRKWCAVISSGSSIQPVFLPSRFTFSENEIFITHSVLKLTAQREYHLTKLKGWRDSSRFKLPALFVRCLRHFRDCVSCKRGLF